MGEEKGEKGGGEKNKHNDFEVVHSWGQSFSAFGLQNGKDLGNLKKEEMNDQKKNEVILITYHNETKKQKQKQKKKKKKKKKKVFFLFLNKPSTQQLPR